MLVHQDRISVGIGDHERCWAGGALISLARESHSLRLEATLQLADIGEFVDRLRVRVPARVEGQDVLLEHALEEVDPARIGKQTAEERMTR